MARNESMDALPKLADLVPRYGELAERRERLQNRLEVRSRELEEAKARAARPVTVGAGEFADAYLDLGDDAFDLLDDDSAERVAKLEAEIGRLRKALEKLDEAAAARRRREGQARMREVVVPLHEQNLRDMAQAIVDLLAADAAEHRLDRHWFSQFGLSSPPRWYRLHPTARANLYDLRERIAEELGVPVEDL